MSEIHRVKEERNRCWVWMKRERAKERNWTKSNANPNYVLELDWIYKWQMETKKKTKQQKKRGEIKTKLLFFSLGTHSIIIHRLINCCW